MLPLKSFCFYCLLAFLSRLWLLSDRSHVQGEPLGCAAGVGSEHSIPLGGDGIAGSFHPSLLLPQPVMALKPDLVLTEKPCHRD